MQKQTCSLCSSDTFALAQGLLHFWHLLSFIAEASGPVILYIVIEVLYAITTYTYLTYCSAYICIFLILSLKY